jgi:hypothetical protein
MLKEVVDVLLIRSKFSTLRCFGISYSSNVLCYGRVRPVWPVVVEQLATRDGS